MIFTVVLPLVAVAVPILIGLHVVFGLFRDVPLEPLIFLSILGILVLVILATPPAKTLSAVETQALALSALHQLSQTPKGEVVCAPYSPSLLTTAYSCSVATEPHGTLVTLHCDATACVVPTR